MKSSSHLYDASITELLSESPDNERAFKLNQAAANSGLKDAQLAAGWFYLNGVGVDANLPQAKKWYEKRAIDGCPKALFSLGQIANSEKDIETAIFYFTKAHELGHARASYHLSRILEKANETRAQSLELLTISSKRGFGPATRLLNKRNTAEQGAAANPYPLRS